MKEATIVANYNDFGTNDCNTKELADDRLSVVPLGTILDNERLKIRFSSGVSSGEVPLLIDEMAS